MSLRLLIEATINGTLYRLSNENIYDLTNKYLGFVEDFSGVNWRLTTRHGGMASFRVGDLTLNQNLWGISSPPSWPPAQLIDLDIYYTLSTEAARVLIANATGYRTEVNNSSVLYAVYQNPDSSFVLDTTFLTQNVTTREINDGPAINSVYQWTASGSGTNEFYCTLVGGGDPSITEPDRLWASLPRVRGTAGSLNDTEWDWTDNDSLGFSTIYFRYFGVDPDVLQIGTIRLDYGTLQSAVPRAFGEVLHQKPVELPPMQTTNPTTSYSVYHNAGIRGTGAKQITNITSGGAGVTTITSTAHGFSNGDTVTVEIGRGNYYNGSYVISGVTANTFNIAKDYNTPVKTTGHAYKAGYWRFYENGDPYIGSAVIGVSTDLQFFYLTPRPTGEVTVSGTGYDDAGTNPVSNLEDLHDLVAGRLSLSSDKTGGRATPVPISTFVETQAPLREWYGQILGYATHLAWSDGTTLFLREFLYISGSARVFSEFDVLEDIRYNDENTPLGQIKTVIPSGDWEQPPDKTITVTHTETGYFFASDIDVNAFSFDAGEVSTELALIATAYKSRNVTLTVSEEFFSALPDPGDRCVLAYDTYTVQDSLIHGNVIGMEFDFDQDLITLVLKQILSTI